jgi:allophanate hydrolase subunit 2
MSDLVVQDAGPLTTIQDLGRPGHLRVGIPASGPMDREAFLLANRLIANPDTAAGLECTLIGPRLEFTDERLIAITGADMTPTVNGAPVPAWQGLRVHAGDVLKLGPARSGVRAYLAIAGGIETPPALGSRSTYVPRRRGKASAVSLGRHGAARMCTFRGRRRRTAIV